MVDLTALIVVGSSTHPDGSGNENFFNGMFNAPPYNSGDDLEHVNFFTGPFGINEALQAHSGEDNAVLSSGWGAANASLLLMALQATKDPVLTKTVFILDNNVARPDGGFGTRYPWFALIGVNPIPSPTNTDALGVVDVGYQYDYNSNAPADVLNPVAAVNSLVAYLYRRLNQNDLDLPVNPDGSPSVTCGSANTCGVTDKGAVLACPDARCADVPEGDRVAAYVTQRGKTTYVTYTTNGLPLTNLIRDVVPFGDAIADLTEPVLTAIVNSAYPHGNPIPADPSKYQPATPFSSLPQLVSTAVDHTTPASQATSVSSATRETESTSKIATEEPTVEKKQPKRHVVRDSKKAVPAATAEDNPPSKSDSDVAVDNPTKTKPDDSGVSTHKEDAPKPGKDEKPDKS
ncbi:hypothetical protein A5724_14025 [Mycobacterium sp. ACS1612]|uniref:PE-PPE domain-containing protein n=1 Tax=Mycobacterium sp. ACS1612 TaxID=1834117 RepID=UPI0007FC4C2F|nr:PE-PPE domain-containing protein [Mycobacterium sp. ACS1612]OBF36079.1 hypothetical protein A5724_14025 [Mycobacterium sp. ACS1612]